MANKDKKKKRLMTGTDIALAVLSALGGSVLFMTIALVAGSIMFPDSGRSTAADAPSARPSYYGTLPSRAPTQTPTPEPAESIAPNDTSAPEPTQTPSEAVPDTPAPAPSQVPVQTQAPAPSRTQAPSTPAPTRAPTPTRSPTVQNPAPVVSINPTAPPARQTQAPAQSGGQAKSTDPNGRVIYITDTGQRYHYDNHCNGGTYYPGTWDEVQRRNLTPCNRCVLN